MAARLVVDSTAGAAASVPECLCRLIQKALGGRSRAKAGIMQRISMVALRATARQVIRGVALVGAANVQAHNDRRAEKTAEAAKYDAFAARSGRIMAAPSAPSTAGAPLSSFQVG